MAVGWRRGKKQNKTKHPSRNVRCCDRCAKSKTENFSAESSVCFAIQQACTEGMQLHEKPNSVQAQRGPHLLFLAHEMSLWWALFLAGWSTQHILPHHLICVNSTVRRGSFYRLLLAEERALHLACQQSSVQEDVSMPRSWLLEGCITVSTENKLLTLIYSCRWHLCCRPFMVGLLSMLCSYRMTALR